MIALCSKTYILHEGDSVKMSSKGINKNALSDPMNAFQTVLESKVAGSGCNRGFRSRQNTIFTYEQTRSALSYFYCKRKVLEDGVSTVPLVLTLSPWNISPYVGFSGFNHPLSSYYPTRLNMYDQWFDSAAEAYNYQLQLQNPTTYNKLREDRLSSSWLEKRTEIILSIVMKV